MTRKVAPVRHIARFLRGPQFPWTLILLAVAWWCIWGAPIYSFVCAVDITNAYDKPVHIVTVSTTTDQAVSHLLAPGERKHFRCMTISDTAEDTNAWPVILMVVDEHGRPSDTHALDVRTLNSSEQVILGPAQGQVDLRPRKSVQDAAKGGRP